MFGSHRRVNGVGSLSGRNKNQSTETRVSRVETSDKLDRDSGTSKWLESRVGIEELQRYRPWKNRVLEHLSSRTPVILLDQPKCWGNPLSPRGKGRRGRKHLGSSNLRRRDGTGVTYLKGTRGIRGSYVNCGRGKRERSRSPHLWYRRHKFIYEFRVNPLLVRFSAYSYTYTLTPRTCPYRDPPCKDRSNVLRHSDPYDQDRSPRLSWVYPRDQSNKRMGP